MCERARRDEFSGGSNSKLTDGSGSLHGDRSRVGHTACVREVAGMNSLASPVLGARLFFLPDGVVGNTCFSCCPAEAPYTLSITWGVFFLLVTRRESLTFCITNRKNSSMDQDRPGDHVGCLPS